MRLCRAWCSLLPPQLLLGLLLAQLPQVGSHRATGPRFLISDRDRDPQCNLHCSRSQSKPLCASDGRTYESMCDYQRAKCRDSALSVVHRGRCKEMKKLLTSSLFGQSQLVNEYLFSSSGHTLRWET